MRRFVSAGESDELDMVRVSDKHMVHNHISSDRRAACDAPPRAVQHDERKRPIISESNDAQTKSDWLTRRHPLTLYM